LQQLLFLETVLEEGSLVRAADRLHTTHSTILRSLKALANGLGIRLFDKMPHGLKPSSVGRVYAAEIRSSLEQAKLAFDLARYETNLHRQSFYVGHSPYIHSGLLPSSNNSPCREAKLCPSFSEVRRRRGWCGEFYVESFRQALVCCPLSIRLSGSSVYRTSQGASRGPTPRRSVR
jgi:hypothetical protein